MYTKEELSSMKYGELLKVLKNLGIKGTRQKTAKVIELILQNQNTAISDEHSTPSSKIKDQFVEAEPGEASNTSCSEKENKPNEVQQISTSSETVKTPIVCNPLRRRTRTFVISSFKQNDNSDKKEEEESPLEVSTVEESLLNISGPFSRSSTFVLDDLSDDSLTSSLDLKNTLDCVSDLPSESKNETEKVKQTDGLLCSNVDLSCKEIQTAEDIEGMESGKVSISPSANTKIRRIMRRSLRGQLLESKIYGHENLAPPLVESSNNSALQPQEGNKSEDQQPSKSFEPNLSVPKSFEFGKNSTTAPKDSKSAIPRFISYARKLNMPNFAKIHENAFKKMEALDEYVERKHSRTTSVTESSIPLVVRKTPRVKIERENPSVKKKTVEKIDKTSSKKLTTHPPALGSSSKRRSSTLASLTKTTTRNSQRSSITESQTKSIESSSNKSSAIPSLVKENLPPRSPLNLWNKSKRSSDTPGSLKRRKEYIPFSKPVLNVYKKNPSPDTAAKHRLTHGGRSNGAVNRREILKKAVNRKPNVKSSSEIRASEKVFIKGVRTNRRFELQMAKRGLAPT